uniref:hypothetical protein n=1 Tax=Nocardioides sp. LML1-1-1.1 TaxID=3135248 RepID=UPI003446E778
MRKLIVGVCLAVFVAVCLVAATSPSASATTTRTISGKITCAKGNLSYGSRVVGVWVQSSAGGSKWSDSLSRSSTYGNIATFSAKVKTNSSSTTIRLDIGCGGTKTTWASNNSTPSITVKGDKTGLRIKCSEATGSRAQRCSYISSSTCSSAYGIKYPISATSVKMRFKDVPIYRNYNGTSSKIAMRVEGTNSGSVSYSVSAGVSAEVKAVLVKAQASVSSSLTTTNSSGWTNEVTISVPAKQYGYAMYVSYGKKVKWAKQRVNSTCSSTSTLSSGVYNFPSNGDTGEGWYVWTSTS